MAQTPGADQIDIAYREKAVADENQIAAALRECDEALKTLSFEEQCELVRLMVRGLKVNRMDLERTRFRAD